MMTEDQATRVSADNGWALGRESWAFHRAFYRRFGRPMAFREYAYLLGQVWTFRRRIGQKVRDRLDPVICFVTTYDGQDIAVQAAGQILRRLMDGDSFVTPREAWAIGRAFWFEYDMMLSPEDLLSLQAQEAYESGIATLKCGNAARPVNLCAEAIPEDAWDVCRAFWLDHEIRLSRRELTYLRATGGFGRPCVAIRRKKEFIVTLETTYKDRMRLVQSIDTKYGLTVSPGACDSIRQQIAASQPVLTMEEAQGIYQVTLTGGQRIYVLADGGKPIKAKRAAGVEQELEKARQAVAAQARKRPVLTLGGLRPARAG